MVKRQKSPVSKSNVNKKVITNKNGGFWLSILYPLLLAWKVLWISLSSLLVK